MGRSFNSKSERLPHHHVTQHDTRHDTTKYGGVVSPKGGVLCYTGPYTWYASDKGGVLADDMGLGKTLQTIAFLAAVLKSPAAGPYTPPLLSST